MTEEYFEIVDEKDRVIGQAPRSECHGNPELVHRAAHVLLFDSNGQLLLQKRADTKDIQPGKWDTSVGGHLDPGEDYKQAAVRELEEELGLTSLPLTFLYYTKIRNDIESENVATYLAVSDDEIFFSPHEISDVAFWSAEQINRKLGSGVFTPNFEQEWAMYCDWQRRYLSDTVQDKAFCAGDSFPDLIRRFSADND